ncbi:MAG: hypothetical protein HY799_03045 [Nitrosomonadales bacterium]|nr:hypothetical protein [Nitrosomonadales bacterium]
MSNDLRVVFSKSAQLRIAAWMFVLAWFLLLAFLMTTIAGSASVLPHADFVVGFICVTFAITAAICIPLAVRIRCPICGERVFIENGKYHESAPKSSWLGYSPVVVKDVIAFGRFTCMHCGQSIQLKPA